MEDKQGDGLVNTDWAFLVMKKFENLPFLSFAKTKTAFIFTRKRIRNVTQFG